MASIPTLVAPAKHRLVPLMARVLARKLESQVEKTTSGIFVPDSHESDSQIARAKVLACGPGEKLFNGAIVPVSVKEGDTIVVPDYAGSRVKIGDEEEVFLYEDTDVIGIMHE